MKQLYLSISLFTLLSLAYFKTNAQAELGFSDDLQCANYTYCVDLEINATVGNSFDIGTSSFLLKYDPSVVSYSEYTPVQFDETTAACPNVWAAQKTDVDSLKGHFGLTIKLLDNMGTCLTVGNTPSVIGTACFNVIAQGEIPNITFEDANTRINSKTPDNGTNAISIAAIDTLNVPNSLACDCSGVGAPCDDLNVFTINDQYDVQCLCKGTLEDLDVDGIFDGVDDCLDVFYEAEEGTVVGAQVKNNQPLYFGSGFVDYASKTGDTLSLTINIDSPGEYDLKFRYANAASDSLPRYLKFIIDTTVIADLFAFPFTGISWADWSEITWTDSISAGTHTIYLLTNGKHGPNLDRVSVSSCGNCAQAGTACDDSDSCTTSDTYDTDCDCKGVYKDSDDDGVCDVQDVCAGSDDNVDADGDNIPDGCDDCDNNLIGTSCDDNDPCTINDVYDASCQCAGIFTGNDTDMDGVCDVQDVCPGFDDTLDVDGDGTPDDCDPCNDLTVGQPCDDGNPCTVLDVITPGCGCGGIPIYLELVVNIDSIACHGGSANIDLTPEHAVGGIYFQWDNGAYTEDLSNVLPGTYIVTATDWRNCQITDTVEITEPTPLEMSLLTTPSNGANGEINAVVSGGTAPYSYLWNTTDSTQHIDSLPSDRYYVSITDSLNCSVIGFADVPVDTICGDTLLQYEYGEKINLQTINYNFAPAMDGYARLGNNDAHSSVTLDYDFPDYGNYQFTIRYSHRTSSRKVNIYLDTTLMYDALNLPVTGNDSTFESAIFTIDSIPPGIHSIMTERNGTTNNQSRLDYLAVCKTQSLACNLVGTACDDGDICTVNDTIYASCNCIGTFVDSDNDSVCDSTDICPGADDFIDSDLDGIPDGCDDCYAFRYEAENAFKKGPVKRTGGSGWSGTGYMDYKNIIGDTLRFTVEAQAAGMHNFNIRYTINATNRYLDILVNGALLIDSLYFPDTDANSTNWQDLPFSADLVAGQNIVEMVTDSTHGPNIDFISHCLPDLLHEPTIAKGNGSYEEQMGNWSMLHFWSAGTTQIDTSTNTVYCGTNSTQYSGAASEEQLYADIEYLRIDSVYTLHFYASGDSATGYIGSLDHVYSGLSFKVDGTPGNSNFVHHAITFTATEPTMRAWFDFYPNTPIILDAFSFDNAPCCDTLNNGGIVFINGSPLASGLYTKNKEIQSVAIIDDNADVTFKATWNIALEREFEVKLGSEFLAVIEDVCSQAPPPIINMEAPVFLEINSDSNFIKINRHSGERKKKK